MTKNVIVSLSVIFAKKYYLDLEHTKTHTLEKYVEENVSKYLDIAQKVSICDSNLIALQKEFNNKQDCLRKEKLEVWKLCDHPIKTYHPDPSGNNGSWSSCDICGKEL